MYHRMSWPQFHNGEPCILMENGVDKHAPSAFYNVNWYFLHTPKIQGSNTQVVRKKTSQLITPSN